MPLRNKHFSLLAILILFASFFASTINAQEDDGFVEGFNPEFQTYIEKFFYFPGDTVGINIYGQWREKLKPDFKIIVYKIKDAGEFLKKQSGNYYINVIGSDTSNLLNLCEAVDSLKSSLKFEERRYGKNKQYVTYISNGKMNYIPRSNGIYIARVVLGKRSAYVKFNVTRIGLIVYPSNNSILTYAVDRLTGKPIDSVSLDYFIGYLKTDSAFSEEGVYNKVYTEKELELNYRRGYSRPLIIVKKGDDVTISDFKGYFGMYQAPRYTAYIYTNQSVYRPSSRVSFFGVIRENTSWGYGNVPEKDVAVTLKDNKRAELFKKVLKTDANGCFNDSLVLDEDASLGVYEILAEIEKFSRFETESSDVKKEVFSAVFSVEEFKKPEYKVELKTDKSQYSDGEQLTIHVKADYYFGSPVQDAYVEYNIFKKPLFRNWWYYSPYRWWYESYYSHLGNNQQYNNSILIYNDKGNLDSEGKLDINYTIDEDFKIKYLNGKNVYYNNSPWETDMIYVIEVTVRDKSRRNINAVSTVNVTRSDYFLIAQADRYMVKPSEKIGVEVKSIDFSDKPVECRYNITLNRITYIGKYPKQRKITDFVTTLNGKTRSDGSSLAFFDAGKEGYYSFEVTSFDSKKRKITAGAGCFVSSGKMNWWSLQPGAVEIFADKESYKPGDTCHALVVCGHDTANVIEVSSNRNLISYSTDRIEGGSRFIDVPVTGLCMPDFYISVSYIDKGVIYTKSKPVIVIPENKFLNVEINSDKQVYKPRDEAEVSVKVTDVLSNPVKNARLTLSMVDESIYAVKQDNTSDIKKAFFSPEFSYSSPYFRVQNLFSQSHGDYNSLYLMYNYKTLRDSLYIVRGRVLDRRGNAFSNVRLMLNKNYFAALTAKDGTFEFKVPEGNYTVSLIINDMEIDGEFNVNIKNQKNSFLEIKTNDEALISAWLNDKETGELKVRGGVFDKIGIHFTDSLISEIEIEGKRKGIDVEQSGRIVVDTLSIINWEGMKGIQNISAKTSGVILDEKKEEFVEADTRKDFRDAVYWSADVQTDKNGIAKVKVKLPDNLTTWRITARAITDSTDVGQSTGSVLCRKDLIIRVETPRFFQQRDEVTVSTIVHNYLNEDKKTKVKLSVDNLTLDSEPEMMLDLKKNEERRIDWKVKVRNPVGIAKITGSALTNEESDAMEIKAPIQPYGLKVSSSMSFDFSKNSRTVTRVFDIPEDVDVRTAKLKINISPSIVSSILSSLNSLIAYPYGCMEQTISRFVPAVLVKGILRGLGALENEYLSVQLPKVIKKGLAKIYAFQHSDGGWGWWSNDKSEPFMSTYVAYGLTLARRNGILVKDGVYKKGLAYITSLLPDNKLKVDTTTLAFSLYCLSETDSADYDFIKSQLRRYEEAEMNDFAKALFALASLNAGDNKAAREYIEGLSDDVKYTDDGVYWSGKILRYGWQYDNIQTTSFVLKALLADEKSRRGNKELIEKAVDWLMLQRKGNSWGSTQQNAFIIYALSDYVKATGELEPDYSIKIFSNGALIADKKVTKEDVYSGDIIFEIDTSNLKRGENNLRLEKTGAGKVYFSSDFSYYSGGKEISSDDHGFEVERKYYKLTREFDSKTKTLYYRKKEVKGTVKSGDVILVKISVFPSDKFCSYFLMEDPIPAGCEIVQDDWAYNIQGEGNYSSWDHYWWRWWYSERTIRDNRVSFFASRMYGETYEFSYLMRAEIPGKFNVMPSHAMLMYYPESNGNGESRIIKIED
jgi:uncharacterized protein YfaS (alpha-2-macroglobulin family)